jgi:hypothetical protein
MHKTTIMLTDDLKLIVEQEAMQRGVSMGEIIRTALRELMTKHKENGGPDPLFDYNLVHKGSCEKDISTHHDDYLYGTT